jgi:hypothetical protein
MIFSHKFDNDFFLIRDTILKKEKFAFSKFADGEIMIMQKRMIRNIDNWLFNPSENDDFSNMLYDSLKFNDEGYHIGISCPCCDYEGHKWLMNNKGPNFNQTTFANIFVNNNYIRFKNELLPAFNNYEKIILIANKDSNLKNIKNVLNFTDFYGIGDEAFKTDLSLVDILKNKISIDSIEDSLFLFCAGPLGNVLSHKLWEHNKKNTYVDIGSTLNPWFGRNLRDYQSSGIYSNKICTF